MLKNYTLGIVLFFSSVRTMANCEMYSAGYHTIAIYRNEDKSFNTEEALISFKIKNGFIEIDTGGSDPLYRKNFSYSSLFNVKMIQVGKSTCKVEGKSELLLSYLNKNSILKIPLCKQFNVGDIPNLEGQAFLNYKNSTLYLPKPIYTIPLVELDKEQELKIEKNISEILKTKFFRGETQFVLAPDEYAVEKFDHRKFENTNMVVTNVTAISNQKNEKLRVKFGLTFISFEGVSWYIADSSYIDPCESDGGGWYESKKATREAEHDRFIGRLIELKVGYIFGEEKYPRLISFYGNYLMEFGKKLVVIDKKDEIEYDFKDFGLQNKNPLLKQK